MLVWALWAAADNCHGNATSTIAAKTVLIVTPLNKEESPESCCRRILTGWMHSRAVPGLLRKKGYFQLLAEAGRRLRIVYLLLCRLSFSPLTFSFLAFSSLVFSLERREYFICRSVT